MTIRMTLAIIGDYRTQHLSFTAMLMNIRSSKVVRFCLSEILSLFRICLYWEYFFSVNLSVLRICLRWESVYDKYLINILELLFLNKIIFRFLSPSGKWKLVLSLLANIYPFLEQMRQHYHGIPSENNRCLWISYIINYSYCVDDTV